MMPKYQQPGSPVPKDWPTGASYKESAASDKTAADIPWQEFFTDPVLQKLIGDAIANNRDMRVAVLNIERSAALYQIQRAPLFPEIDGTANANFQRVPTAFSTTGTVQEVHQYSVGLGLAAYELDLFGRVRSLKAQALYQYLATEQARRAVQITIVSQVAIAYLNLLADKEHLQLAKDTFTNQEAYYKMIENRFKVGINSALDLNQARTSVEAARSDIASFTTLVAQDENFLSLLVGKPIDTSSFPPNISGNIISLKDIAPGTSSDVLLNRPDILQAEDQLKGANANIGAARAAFFPRITLVSSVGFGAADIAKLFEPGSFAWNISPNITIPIFDAGVNKANLAVANVDRNIYIAQYEKAIQTAFREVADALAQRGTIDEQMAAQQAFTDATRESYKLSKARFDQGIDSFLNVLDSQRSMYSAEQNLITTKLTQLANLVTLYKVLGGGEK